MTYYHFEGSLVQPTMEEPKPRYAGGEIPSMIKHAWRDHLRSLPKIKVEGKLKEGWVEEKGLQISDCERCGGQGWTAEHDIYCNGDCYYCPVQVQCEHCLATGKVAVPVSETEAQGESDLPKIYIASKTKHAQRWIEWRESGVNIISTWIDEAGEGASPDLADLCKRCINECLECDAMIIYREGEDYLKGAFIEMGVALTRKIPIILVGDILPESSVFTQNGNVFTAETVEETIDDIKRNHHPNSQEERKHTDKEEYAKGLLEWIRDQDYVLSDYRAGKWYQLPFRETSHYYTALELLKEYDKYLNP
jgi:hypothetical protein